VEEEHENCGEKPDGSAAKYRVLVVENDELKKRFSYHRPNEDQPERYEKLRAMAKDLAKEMHRSCPRSRELSLALTKLEEAVMWANAGIARNE